MDTQFGVSAPPSVIALGVLLALAVLALVVAALWRGVDRGSLFTYFLIGVGGAFSLIMLVVTIVLMGRVWGDMGPAPAMAPAGEPKDALSNAMTVMGLTVAVVTLVLTIGTSWFAMRLEKIAKFEEQMNRQLERLRLELDARLLNSDELPQAKLALRQWFGEQSAEDPGALAHDYSLWLEMLTASDHRIRFKAYGQLRALGSYGDATLEPVEKFTLSCHELAVSRLHSESGTPLSRNQVQERVEKGLWCKIFDRREQKRYLAQMPQ
jgi:hypothetical protein